MTVGERGGAAARLMVPGKQRKKEEAGAILRTLQGHPLCDLTSNSTTLGAGLQHMGLWGTLEVWTIAANTGGWNYGAKRSSYREAVVQRESFAHARGACRGGVLVKMRFVLSEVGKPFSRSRNSL